MAMEFNEEQRKAITSEKPLIVISAGAGSGKTRVLTERFVYICEQKLEAMLMNKSTAIGATVEDIVAITFTEKAAREMKSRIRARIEEKLLESNKYESFEQQERANAFWQKQKELLDTALISTFHSFCHKLLHEFAFQANIPPTFSLLDDVQARLIQQDILDNILNQRTFYQQTSCLLDYFSRNQLMKEIITIYGKVKEFQADVSIHSYFHAKEIINQQLEQIEQKKQLLWETFIVQAEEIIKEFPSLSDCSGKLKEHLNNLFICFENLKKEDRERAYQELCSILPSSWHASWAKAAPAFEQFYKQLWKPLKDNWGSSFSSLDIQVLEQVMDSFCMILSSFDEQYEQRKLERNQVDFSDLQQKAISLLGMEEVQQACKSRYLHMMIDEFQDTNPLQMSMLERMDPAYRFIVGDGKQSIYRFRGADVRLMNEMVNQATRSSQADFINMNKNYRTCDEIISFVNSLFSVVMNKEEVIHKYQVGYSTIDSERVRPDQKGPLVELLLVDESTEEDQNEYDLIAKRMLEIRETKSPLVERGKRWLPPTWGDMAILIPSRTNLLSLERSLGQRGIPYVVYGGIGFYERIEVREFLNLLHWLNRPWEVVYVAGVLRSPLIGFTLEEFLEVKHVLPEQVTIPEFIYENMFSISSLPEEVKGKLAKFRQMYENLVPFADQMPLKEALEDLFVTSGLKLSLLMQENNLQKINNIEKLINQIESLENYSLEEALKQLQLIAELSAKEGEAETELAEGDAVHIMTVHASKGLEFPIVFTTNLARQVTADKESFRYDEESKLVVRFKQEHESVLEKSELKSPAFEDVQQRTIDEAVEESKRLFYVAATRARDYLVLSSKNKQVKHSWLEMLNKAMEQDGDLPSLIEIKSQVLYDGSWSKEESIYKNPPIIRENLQPLSFSVTEVMNFINDPVSYYYQSIIKADESWFQHITETNTRNAVTSSIDYSLLGTLVHRTCELLDYGFTREEAIKEALDQVEEGQKTETYQEQIAALIEPYSKISMEKLGEPFLNEWNFSTNIEGVTIIGEIDKVVRKNNEYHLIDFKTNFIYDENKLIEQYKPQLYLYKMAFEKEFNQSINKLFLLLLRKKQNPLQVLQYQQEYEMFLRLKIKKMAELKRSNANKDFYVKEKR